MARMTPAEMQAACDRFNARHRLGDEIAVFTGPIGENPKRATVVSTARVLEGHTAVVYVSGEAHGCIALTHVRGAR